ncbi:type 1 glutamine amidotransferase [Oxalobacter sp. OttesenSCG-928-P03]|nr:type 1 glutamine amidotransferase [Oxalobacter sp. OttesenSCG-928-P03]
MGNLNGKKFAVFIDPLFNEQEFIYPYYRLQEAGASVVIAGSAVTGLTGENGMSAATEIAFSELDAGQLDGIVIAGGYGPDKMRKNEACLNLVRAMHEKNKLIAFICHAGWVPISAGILKGKRATSTLSIKDDMINAGCLWEDSEVVVDGNLVSSRAPHDLPAFTRTIIACFTGNKALKRYDLS